MQWTSPNEMGHKTEFIKSIYATRDQGDVITRFATCDKSG